MSSISDKDIDKIFQEAAEKYNTTFDEGAWEDMNRRLDEDGPDGGMGYFKGLGVIIGIFITASVIIGWYALRSTELDKTLPGDAISLNDATPSSEQLKESVNVEVSDQEGNSNGQKKGDEEVISSELSAHNKPDQGVNNKDDIEQSSTNHQIGDQEVGGQDKDKGDDTDNKATVVASTSQNIAEEEDNSSFTQVEEGVSKVELKGEKVVDNETDEKVVVSLVEKDAHLSGDEPSGASLPGNTGEDNLSQMGSSEKVISEEKDISAGAVDRNKQIIVVTEQKQNVPDEKAEPQLTEDNKDAENSAFFFQKNISDEPDSVLRMGYLPWFYQLGDGQILPVPMEAEEKKELLKRGFALKLTYSPDFSSIGYFKPDKPGSNFGLLGEYFIGKRWSISTGAIYSKKIYFNEEGDGYGYSSSPTDRLDADCRVIDIPLNIHYYAQQADNHSLYLTAGASSYMMLRENYYYTKTGTSGPWSWSEEIKNENSHWFSILNLSIGYERRISQHIFLQLEPFLKAPMSGVGEGKVDLVSTGAFLNLKYQFIPK